MKKYLYSLLIAFTTVGLFSCSDDKQGPGNPEATLKTELQSAFYGDSLKITVDLQDEIPLFNFYATVYYGAEAFYGRVVKAESNGEYECTIFLPLMANVADGEATIELVLQNTSLKRTVVKHTISVKRPDYPYITFVTDDEEYKMERIGLHQYQVEEKFPASVRGYFKTPSIGDNSNEINIGYEDGKVKENSTDQMTFSNPGEDEAYTISFNTYSFQASAVSKVYSVNGVTMGQKDSNTYQSNFTFSIDEMVSIENINDLNGWWINPDFFVKDSDNTYKFLGLDGNYRVILNDALKSITIETLNTNWENQTLFENGTGSIWVIGEGIGVPSVDAREVGWNTDYALCMRHLGNKKHQITFVAGKTMRADNINFKFFHQKGWGGEFDGKKISTTNEIVFFDSSGNLHNKEGISFESGSTYVFTIDLTDGNDKAKLDIVKK